MNAPRLQRLAVALVTLAWAMASQPALAAPSQPALAAPSQGDHSYRVDYRAAESCPDREAFTKEVARRSRRAQVVATGGALRATVSIEASPWRGTLSYEGRDGSGQRSVEGEECDEVVSALALMLALLVDPDAELPSPTKSEAAPEPMPPTVGPPPRIRRPAPPRRSVHPFLAVRGGTMRGVGDGYAPQLAAGLGAFFASWPGMWPGVRVDALLARGDADNAAGSAHFDWMALRAAACARHPLDRAFAVQECLTFEGGRLTGEGSNIDAPRTATAPWLGPGGQLAFAVAPLRPLRILAEAGATVMLTRDSFYFRPAEVVHRIAPVIPHFGLALEAEL
ncbi:MAG: hypothetical protein R3B13_04670 [Polyangiaceae bacterium]